MTTKTRTEPAAETTEGTPPPAELPQDAPAGVGLPTDPDEHARVVQGLVQRSPGQPPRLTAEPFFPDDPDRDDHPLTVWEAIAEVTRRVGHISKDRTATSGGTYRFRGIDDVLLALHPLLGDAGLIVMPGEVRDARWETRSTSGGGTLNVARLLIRYRLIGPDGSETFGEAWGEGGDSGDKATQKAHSQSYKSFALQLFSIPTEQSSDDEPDATNPPARPFTADEVARATTAARAGDDADTVDALAVVRRRALALLTVPVPLEDGSVAPLGVLFDQRRAQLERPGGEQS